MHFLASLPLLALVVPARAGFEVPAPHLLQERDGKHIGPPLSGSYKRGLDDAVVVEARDGRHLGPNPSGVAGYRRHATSPLGSTFGLSAHRWKREILERDTCSDVTTQSVQGSCYPALSKAKTPAFPTGTATPAALAKWFCPAETEYAWLGFSYDVEGCLPYDQLYSDLSWMKNAKYARYVRIFGTCDNDGFLNDLVNAAAAAGVGIYGLVWFGFDGDGKWKNRMKQWISIIKTNQKAAYVIRNIAVGTEPLFDSVMTPAQLAKQINTLKSALSSYGVQVTLADMPYSFQQNANAPEVFAAVDTVSLNVAPFFNNDATTAAASWHSVAWNVGYGKQYGLGKTVTVVQTGWPSNTQVWPANSPNAVASVQQEQAYYDMLNGQCNWFKAQNVGWFSHIYNDDTLPGWGILDSNGGDKFPFWPQAFCEGFKSG